MIHFEPSRTSQSHNSVFLIKRNEFEELRKIRSEWCKQGTLRNLKIFLDFFTFRKVVKIILTNKKFSSTRSF